MRTARAFELGSVPLFAALPPDRLEHLRHLLTPVAVRRGRTVYREGDPANRVYLVLAGTVGLGSLGVDGKRGLLSLASAGDSFGELSVVEERRSHDAEALEDCDLRSLDSRVVAALVRSDPQIADAFIQILANRLRRSSDALRDAILLDAPGRLARRLCELAEHPSPPAITQQALAHMIGASRETVNRALAQFARQGLVHIRSGRCSVVDVAALQERAGL